MLTYERKPVHGKFSEWLNDTIINAASAMINHLAVPITPDQLFDAVVPISHQKILREASKLMPQVYSQTYQVKISNDLTMEYPTKAQSIPVVLAFRYSEADHFLIPQVLNPLREHSPLAGYLLPSFRIAREFSILRYAVTNLINITTNRDMLAALFPWLPDLVSTSGWMPYKEPTSEWRVNEAIVNVTSVSERLVIDRSFAGAMKHGTGRPLMHSEVLQALNLGNRLFTQYRLLKSQEQINRRPDTYTMPILSDDLVPLSLVNALQETRAFYNHEREQWERKKLTGRKP